jgi:hypothetical protein
MKFVIVLISKERGIDIMGYIETINQLFDLVIIPLLAALTIYAVKWINAQADKLKTETDNEILDKYLVMLAETVTKCVIATNQTYVESLKKEGKFDAEAQKVAFEKTYDAVMSIISIDMVEYLTEFVGDFETFLMQSIEAEVNANK